MDSFYKSLDKFKQLLYQLKEKPFMEDSVTSNAFSNSHSESHLSQFSQDKKSNKKQIQKVNIDVLSFLLKYFEEHMIPETHWSKKKKEDESSIYSFLSKLNFSCFAGSSDENS